jgi:hypothetical protein
MVMYFIYLYEIEQLNLLQRLELGWGGVRGRGGGDNLTNEQYLYLVLSQLISPVQQIYPNEKFYS